MKKYLFVFTCCAIIATVACDTSSKASTTQTLTAAAPPPPPEPVAVPIPITDSIVSPTQMKKAFVKKQPGMMERAPMTKEERHRMLQGPPEVPAKKQ